MSAILWRELVKQGAMSSRNQVKHLLKQNAVRVLDSDGRQFTGGPIPDGYDDWELPGKTIVRIGYKKIVIPCTYPEDEHGIVMVSLADVIASE